MRVVIKRLPIKQKEQGQPCKKTYYLLPITYYLQKILNAILGKSEEVIGNK